MNKNLKILLIILFINLINVVGVGLLNLHLSRMLPTGSYHAVNNNTTIFSPDNEYYLDPVDNYLNGKGWRRNPPLGNGSYFRRTPGYSILYFISAKITNNHPVYKFYTLIFIQVLLQLLSVIAIWNMLAFLTNSIVARIITLCIYAIVPFVSSYAFMTITESLYPHLIIFYLYWLLKAYYDSKYSFKERIGAFVLAALFLSFSIMTRPVTAILGIPLVFLFYEIIKNDRIIFNKKLHIISILLLFPLLIIGTWTYRNYYIAGEFVPLEVAFHPESHDRMKPEFKGLFSFVKAWGEDGAAMNEWQLPLYNAAITGDTSVSYVNKSLSKLPEKIVKEFGRPRLFRIISQYQNTVYSLKPYFDKNIPLPKKYTPLEIDTQSRFDSLTSEYAHLHFIEYYIGAPIIYLKRAVLNSGTSNSYVFQQEFRNNKLLVVLRYIFLFIHILLYSSLIFNCFSFRNNSRLWILFFLTPAANLLFFVSYFKEIEQRYLLPTLIILLIGFYRPIEVISNYLKNNYKIKSKTRF